MTASAPTEVDEALRIVGAEDFDTDGERGEVVATGQFAAAIAEQIASSPKARTRLDLNDKPVRISRADSLEVWCNGIYLEGSAVRGVVHRAARSIQA